MTTTEIYNAFHDLCEGFKEQQLGWLEKSKARSGRIVVEAMPPSHINVQCWLRGNVAPSFKATGTPEYVAGKLEAYFNGGL